MQLEVTMFKEFTPSSKRPNLMNGMPQIPIIVSHEQQMKFVMLKTTIIAWTRG
jgi:hypothetical protein